MTRRPRRNRGRPDTAQRGSEEALRLGMPGLQAVLPVRRLYTTSQQEIGMVTTIFLSTGTHRSESGKAGMIHFVLQNEFR